MLVCSFHPMYNQFVSLLGSKLSGLHDRSFRPVDRISSHHLLDQHLVDITIIVPVIVEFVACIE